MTNKQQNKIIFWDIGNVLVKFFEKEFKNSLLKNRINNLSDEDLLGQYQNIMNDSFLGQVSLTETWNKILDLTGLPGDKYENIKKGFKVSVNKELMKYIEDNLKHYRMGIISDLHQIAYQLAIDHCPNIFKISSPNLIYLSNKIGKSKYMHGIDYLRGIFKSLDKNNCDIFYIDDEPDKIEMAGRCGAKTMLFPGISKIERSWRESNKQIIYEFEKILK